jgi:hypothetical protein
LKPCVQFRDRAGTSLFGSRGSYPAFQETTTTFSNVKTPKPSRITIWACAVVWACAIVAGCGVLWSHANRAGARGEPPAAWPQTSSLVRSSTGGTLVMFAHPKCPCTQASLGELAVLRARAGKGFEIVVVFLDPEDTAADWRNTANVEAAAQIPGVTIRFDKGGREAHLFGAATSGHTELYDAGGRLVFTGGITAARGHAGDNAGREAILGWSAGGYARRSETPVFGCALAAAPRQTSPLAP